ncbi:30S ribosomal protein S4 [Candidatus Micrarchaeota archaeon]|nr:30S ribosomal protein S4 [Candidatus Micrarchaeota archaeon]
MGDPRRLRNSYERPKKLWDEDRLNEEKELKKNYGLKNMRELWRGVAELKKYRREARRLLSVTEEERREDTKKLLKKMSRLSLLKEGSVLDDVLSLDVKTVLERRLQTVVLRMGLARTIIQARQLITHGYISVDGAAVTRPGYLVRVGQNVGHGRPIDISVKNEKAEAPAQSAPAQTSTAQ